MKLILIILITFLIVGCDHSKKHDNGIKSGIIHKKNNKKLKSLVSISYKTEVFSPDNLVFDEKVIKNYDTLGNVVEMKRYIVDSTILYEHYFQKYNGDTLVKIEESIGNVYKPKLETCTSKFFDGLLIEKKQYQAIVLL